MFVHISRYFESSQPPQNCNASNIRLLNRDMYIVRDLHRLTVEKVYLAPPYTIVYLYAITILNQRLAVKELPYGLLLYIVFVHFLFAG